MNNKTHLDCAYVAGHLYKTPVNDDDTVGVSGLMVETLTTGEVSTYPTIENNVVSIKTLNGVARQKIYNWIPNQDLMDFASDYISIQGDGMINGVVEKYFALSSPLGLEELAINYELPMPVVGGLLDEFFDVFNDWGMRPLSKTVVASVKFDTNNNPIMLKLYRGGYLPTDTEIQESKDYWADVSS